jgi:hypothetical protein
MQVQIVSKTGAGSSNAIVINTNTNPVNIGFGVVVDGSVDYTVEHTFDSPATGFTTWFPHPTIDGESTDMDGNYAFPITGVRVTVNSGGGTATLNLVQAGIA